MMRAILFSDIHGSIKSINRIIRESRTADVMLSCGDITNFEAGLEGILRRLDSAGIPVFIVPGNHESPQKVERICSLLKNVKSVHKRALSYKNLLIIGYGSGGFSSREKEFKKAAEEFSRIIRKNPEKKVVMLTHAPPHGTRLDLLDGRHVGSRDISDFIRKNKVDLLVCGHLHENSGIIEERGRTTILNPGKFMKIKIN